MEAPPRSLVVVNRTSPRPIQQMLESTFGEQPVAVGESVSEDVEDDSVLLVEHSDDGTPQVVASSTFESIQQTILLVNSDLYKTGTSGVEDFELPSVIRELADVTFRLRGYPLSNREKLLMIAISRSIEQQAWRAGCGRLRSSFQRLSRLSDERGTRRVYRMLGNSPVQTHVYGVPDRVPPRDVGVTVHGGHSTDFRRSWFVVYTPPKPGDTRWRDRTSDGGAKGSEPRGPAALLAVETDDKVWEGYWTFDPALVGEIDGYIERNL